jgi:hypothetical protein
MLRKARARPRSERIHRPHVGLGVTTYCPWPKLAPLPGWTSPRMVNSGDSLRVGPLTRPPATLSPPGQGNDSPAHPACGLREG